MYSFYGGRPGNSFIIVTTFRSVQDMIDAFKLGPDYTAVHYDEYVMINTLDKNDSDNGKIYRRGYNFNEVINNKQTGGAQYIGTIAGPSGNAPNLQLTTITDVRSKNANQNTRKSGSYTLNNNLVPGKSGLGDTVTYNDEIKWQSCYIKNANSEETTAYLGFQFPYTVFDFTAESVESNVRASILDNSDPNHPFYKNLTIRIPKGQNGDFVNNFRVFEINKANKNQIEYYAHKDQDASKNKKIIVYDQHTYENAVDETKTYYLGDYNMLKSLQLSNDGIITAKYTYSANERINELDANNNPIPIKWIKNIEKNTKGLKVNYNTGDPDSIDFSYIERVIFDDVNQKILFYDNLNNSPVAQCPIKTITDITSNDNGNIVISYNIGEATTVPTSIKQIDSVILDNNGELKIKYNDSQSANSINSDNKIKWINNITSSNNQMTITYNTGQPTILNVKNIDELELDNNGRLNVTYKEGNSTTTSQLGTIKWVDRIYVGSDQNIYVDYNTISNQQITNNPIKYILDTKLDSNNNVLIKYSTNENVYENVGTITTRAEYDVGGVYKNISWTGAGTISTNGTVNNRIVTFTLPVTGSFSPNVKSIISDPEAENFGTLNVSDGTHNLGVTIPAGSGTTVLKTFTGIYFQVSFIDSNSELPTSGTVAISVSNMNLKFSADDPSNSSLISEVYVPPQSSNR